MNKTCINCFIILSALFLQKNCFADSKYFYAPPDMLFLNQYKNDPVSTFIAEIIQAYDSDFTDLPGRLLSEKEKLVEKKECLLLKSPSSEACLNELDKRQILMSPHGIEKAYRDARRLYRQSKIEKVYKSSVVVTSRYDSIEDFQKAVEKYESIFYEWFGNHKQRMKWNWQGWNGKIQNIRSSDTDIAGYKKLYAGYRWYSNTKECIHDPDEENVALILDKNPERKVVSLLVAYFFTVSTEKCSQ